MNHKSRVVTCFEDTVSEMTGKNKLRSKPPFIINDCHTKPDQMFQPKRKRIMKVHFLPYLFFFKNLLQLSRKEPLKTNEHLQNFGQPYKTGEANSKRGLLRELRDQDRVVFQYDVTNNSDSL